MSRNVRNAKNVASTALEIIGTFSLVVSGKCREQLLCGNGICSKEWDVCVGLGEGREGYGN